MPVETVIESVDIKIPEGCNVILGQAHFIKTVEDLYEIIITANGNAKFGIAFSEASGERLIRYDGTDEAMIQNAVENIKRLSSGHSFLIVLGNIYPINVLNQIKACQEVVGIFAATANPLSVIVYRKGEGSAILGVIDGKTPVGEESQEDLKTRKDFLRKIGYKR